MAKFGSILVLFIAFYAEAALVLHIQSPWRDDPLFSSHSLYVYGGATGGYSATESNKMQPEGNGWFSFVWEKSVTNFSWESFTIRACAPESDQNCNGGPYWSDSSGKSFEFKMTDVFSSEEEIWFYVDSLNHTDFSKSIVPPGSKIIWFKSPWGNKSLPLLFFGADSVLMHLCRTIRLLVVGFMEQFLLLCLLRILCKVSILNVSIRHIFRYQQKEHLIYQRRSLNLILST